MLSKGFYLFCIACLASCAPFKPILAPEAPHQTVSQNPHPIKLKVIGLDGYQNYAFYNYLQKRLQSVRTKDPVSLEISISQADYNLSYAADATTTRTEHDLIATYELWHNDSLHPSSKPKAHGKVLSTTSYSVDVNDEFSTLNSRLAADEKVLQGLAEEVFREIIATLAA